MMACIRFSSSVARLSHLVMRPPKNCHLTGHGPLTTRGRSQTWRHLSVTPWTSAASTDYPRHWARTVSRPCANCLRHCRLTASPARTNLALIILRAVRLIIFRVVDLHEIRLTVGLLTSSNATKRSINAIAD